MGKPEGKKILEKPRRRWEDNNKTDLTEIGREVGWIHLAQDRIKRDDLVNAVTNIPVPIKYW